jgi:hypothetical protein
MTIPLWSIRRCVLCGAAVKCAPDYPDNIAVVCWRCMHEGSA